MTLRRTTRITFEADETIAIRRWRSDSDTLCTHCGSHLGGVAPHEAAWLLRIDPAQLRSELEAGRLHIVSGDSAGHPVCLASIEKAAQLILPNAKLQIRHTEENS